ncbi:unnamed protein product [Amoebophrya sp. A25]|nr:unnamed protein product [Amoebophrya sp. A25]|eukprot:GSA25T00012658001.1
MHDPSAEFHHTSSKLATSRLTTPTQSSKMVGTGSSSSSFRISRSGFTLFLSIFTLLLHLPPSQAVVSFVRRRAANNWKDDCSDREKHKLGTPTHCLVESEDGNHLFLAELSGDASKAERDHEGIDEVSLQVPTRGRYVGRSMPLRGTTLLAPAEAKLGAKKGLLYTEEEAKEAEGEQLDLLDQDMLNEEILEGEDPLVECPTTGSTSPPLLMMWTTSTTTTTGMDVRGTTNKTRPGGVVDQNPSTRPRIPTKTSPPVAPPVSKSMPTTILAASTTFLAATTTAPLVISPKSIVELAPRQRRSTFLATTTPATGVFQQACYAQHAASSREAQQLQQGQEYQHSISSSAPLQPAEAAARPQLPHRIQAVQKLRKNYLSSYYDLGPSILVGDLYNSCAPNVELRRATRRPGDIRALGDARNYFEESAGFGAVRSDGGGNGLNRSYLNLCGMISGGEHTVRCGDWFWSRTCPRWWQSRNFSGSGGTSNDSARAGGSSASGGGSGGVTMTVMNSRSQTTVDSASFAREDAQEQEPDPLLVKSIAKSRTGMDVSTLQAILDLPPHPHITPVNAVWVDDRRGLVHVEMPYEMGSEDLYLSAAKYRKAVAQRAYAEWEMLSQRLKERRAAEEERRRPLQLGATPEDNEYVSRSVLAAPASSSSGILQANSQRCQGLPGESTSTLGFSSETLQILQLSTDSAGLASEIVDRVLDREDCYDEKKTEIVDRVLDREDRYDERKTKGPQGGGSTSTSLPKPRWKDYYRPPMETKRIIQGMLKGLAHMHANRLVHGDVKPENVLLKKKGLSVPPGSMMPSPKNNGLKDDNAGNAAAGGSTTTTSKHGGGGLFSNMTTTWCSCFPPAASLVYSGSKMVPSRQARSILSSSGQTGSGNTATATYSSVIQQKSDQEHVEVVERRGAQRTAGGMLFEADGDMIHDNGLDGPLMLPPTHETLRAAANSSSGASSNPPMRRPSRSSRRLYQAAQAGQQDHTEQQTQRAKSSGPSVRAPLDPNEAQSCCASQAAGLSNVLSTAVDNAAKAGRAPNEAATVVTEIQPQTTSSSTRIHRVPEMMVDPLILPRTTTAGSGKGGKRDYHGDDQSPGADSAGATTAGAASTRTSMESASNMNYNAGCSTSFASSAFQLNTDDDLVASPGTSAVAVGGGGAASPSTSPALCYQYQSLAQLQQPQSPQLLQSYDYVVNDLNSQVTANLQHQGPSSSSPDEEGASAAFTATSSSGLQQLPTTKSDAIPALQQVVPSRLLVEAVCSHLQPDVKLIDFDHSRVFAGTDGHRKYYPMGTPAYTSPENLYRKYFPQSDLWSVGATMYVLLTGDIMLRGDLLAEIRNLMTGRPVYHVLGGNRSRWLTEDEDVNDEDGHAHGVSRLAAELRSQVSQAIADLRSRPYLDPSAVDLCGRLLSLDWQQRGTALEVLQHPWFSEASEAL